MYTSLYLQDVYANNLRWTDQTIITLPSWSVYTSESQKTLL